MLGVINTTIWLYQEPVDFRKQMDGLVVLVADKLGMDPADGGIYVFRNKGADKVKLLVWDRNGFWLCYKRLEKGRFKFPGKKAETVKISGDQMQWLLSGLCFEKHEELPQLKPSRFY